MKLYFKSLVTVRNSVLTYTQTSMIAEIGAYIGLLLGVSLLDLTKFINHLFLSNVTHLTKCCSSNKK